jgi:hypothetical protein
VLALPAGQRPAYVLPLLPPVAVLAARAVVVVAAGRSRRALAVGGWALAVAAVAVLGVTQWLRARRVAAEPLRAFAQAVAQRVPAGADLRATHGVDESDVLVLGHLLGRALLRGRPRCDGARRYYLGPMALSERASLRVLARLERAGREPLALMRCARPPGAVIYLDRCAGATYASPDVRHADGT